MEYKYSHDFRKAVRKDARSLGIEIELRRRHCYTRMTKSIWHFMFKTKEDLYLYKLSGKFIENHTGDILWDSVTNYIIDFSVLR